MITKCHLESEIHTSGDKKNLQGAYLDIRLKHKLPQFRIKADLKDNLPDKFITVTAKCWLAQPNRHELVSIDLMHSPTNSVASTS